MSNRRWPGTSGTSNNSSLRLQYLSPSLPGRGPRSVNRTLLHSAVISSICLNLNPSVLQVLPRFAVVTVPLYLQPRGLTALASLGSYLLQTVRQRPTRLRSLTVLLPRQSLRLLLETRYLSLRSPQIHPDPHRCHDTFHIALLDITPRSFRVHGNCGGNIVSVGLL